MTRLFTQRQRAILYLRARGICQRCGCILNPADWHADHKIPFSHGGPTELWNGQALCPPCNLSKMTNYTYNDYLPLGWKLRPWQDAALQKFIKHGEQQILLPADQREAFLLNAFPGSGKSLFQQLSAVYMKRQGTIDFCVFLVPRDKLRTDFGRDAKAYGLMLHSKPNLKVNLETMDGIVMTYDQLTDLNVSTLKLWCQTRRVMVSADEVHHLSDRNGWGDKFAEAFDDSAVRLQTTGTPFRSDGAPIPWTDHRIRGDKLVLTGPSAFSFGYADALANKDANGEDQGGLVREVQFHSWDGVVSWRDRDGQEFTHEIKEDLGATYKDMATEEVRALEGARRRHCLNPEFAYTRDQLKEANSQLMDIRKNHPWAGGLVICIDRDHADRVAEILAEISGTSPVVIHGESDDYKSKLEGFQVNKTASREPWLVAVDMVSEGVDIKHLRVGVFLDRKKTAMYWTQSLGRILRFEEGAGEEQMAHFYQYNDGYNSRVEHRDVENGTNAIYLRKYADNIMRELESFIKSKARKVCKVCGQNPCICPKEKPTGPRPPMAEERGIGADGEDNERLFEGDSIGTKYVKGITPFASAVGMNPVKFMSLLKKQNPDFWKQAYEAMTNIEEDTNDSN